MPIIVHPITRAEKALIELSKNKEQGWWTIMHMWSEISSPSNRRGSSSSWHADALMNLMTIDRLNVLRSVSIFTGAPNELLAAISAVLAIAASDRTVPGQSSELPVDGAPDG